MLKVNDICVGCSACFSRCPKQAIKMKKNVEGFLYPEIDKKKCIKCGLCENVCPLNNKKEKVNRPIAYACYNLDDVIRKESSSGGIFTAIANKFLKNKGVVYGAGFQDDLVVKHLRVENKKDLSKLRGAKYVQSEIGECYKSVEVDLKNGKEVLFTGTPCQVEGLKSFLGKEYNGLFTQDIICHGVPSPVIFEKYIAFYNNSNISEIKKFSFREKNKSWKNYNIYIETNDGIEKREKINKNIYMRAFLGDICLRKSCYNCMFKKINRISDVTLADFWGINVIDKEMDDDKGTSLVIINSKKGKELFESIDDKIRKKKVNLEESIKYNSSMIKSVEVNKNRDIFFREINEKNFKKIVNKYLPKKKMYKRVLGRIKKALIKKEKWKGCKNGD